jgi:uncharacterized protein DUF6789
MSTSSPVARHVTSPLPDIVGLGGALAGLGGGLAMAIVGAIISASLGGDIWLEAKQIAAVVYGPAAAAQPGFAAGPVLVGTLLHLIVSAVLGALFSIVTRRVLHLTSEFGTPLLTGLIYGMLIWLVAYFVVLPIINPLLRETYAPAFIVQHLVYGAVTGLLYTWLRPQPYNPYG